MRCAIVAVALVPPSTASILLMSTLPDLVRGCTFDDLLFTPQYSVLERRDPSAIDLSCSLSQHLTLKRPIVSANMDTCLLYTSDAADERSSVDLGGRRIIKKKIGGLHDRDRQG